MVTLNVTSGQYVSLAHRLLWDSSQRHLIIASERSEDSWMLHLSAGLLAAAAFEAYLNYLGEELLPNVWAEERDFFSTGQYRGTEGKLKRIAEELEWQLPPKPCKPRSDVIALQDLRNKMVHARPDRGNYHRLHKEGEFTSPPSTWLYLEAPEPRIRDWIADVEAFSVLLHNAVLKSEFRDVVFGSHPFLGAIGYGTLSVEPAPAPKATGR